jgi:hypothetical protein
MRVKAAAISARSSEGSACKQGKGDEAQPTCVSVHGVLRKFEGEKALELTLRTGVLAPSASKVCAQVETHVKRNRKREG